MTMLPTPDSTPTNAGSRATNAVRRVGGGRGDDNNGGGGGGAALVPYTNGGGGLAAGNGGGGLAQANPYANPAPALTWADAVRVVRANVWVIVALLVVGVVGGVALNVALARYAPRYRAYGILQIEPIMSQNPLVPTPAAMDMNALAIEQRSHQMLLSQETLVSRVFQNAENNLRKTTWFARFVGPDGKPDVAAAKRALHAELVVRAYPGTDLIELSIDTRHPQDAREIVQTIGEQYVRDQQSETRRDQLKRSAQLTQLKDQYERGLRETAARVRERALQLNIDGMGTPGRMSAKEEELKMLVREQRAAEARHADARGRYEMVVRQVGRGETPGAVNELVERDPLVAAAQQQVVLAQRDAAEAVSSFGPSHPRVRQHDQRLGLMNERLDQARGERTSYHTAIVVEQLQSELAVARDALAGYAGTVDAMKKELGTLTNAMSDYLAAREEEGALRERLQKVNDELNVIRQADSQNELGGIGWAPGGVPVTPEEPVFPKLPITVGLCGLLGLGLGVGFAFVRELTDQSVRSPADIQRLGHLALLGVIGDRADDPEAARAASSAALVIFQSPASLMADQFRQVRTRLQYAASLDTTRSILVTSPGVGDGKTTVACNLAVGLALNGRRILLVDADFRRPQVHTVFGLDNARGFADVLADPAAAFDGAVRGGVLANLPNLGVLPAGAKPGNATELLESRSLTDFLERAAEEYDHVIFDCGSLMVVSEAVALAPRVDGVVTVVRARHNSRGLLARVRDTLRQVKAEHLGVILNGARALGGGYYGKNIRTYYSYQTTQRS